MITSLLSASRVLSQSSPLNRRGSKKRKGRNIAPILMLTSLVDTFSVLVVYLLVNFSAAGEMLYLSEGMELPAANQVESLLRNLVVKIDKGEFYVEEKKVAMDQLTGKLVTLRRSWDERFPNQDFTGALTIQADRRDEFSAISTVIQAAAHAGFSDIHFASIKK